MTLFRAQKVMPWLVAAAFAFLVVYALVRPFVERWIMKRDKIFGVEESWRMSEVEKVVALISAVECWRLGNWDGCCCSSFNLRGVEVDISCGKGREQAIWISVPCNGDIPEDPEALKPIMAEVARQVEEQSGRGGNFAQYFHAWRTLREIA